MAGACLQVGDHRRDPAARGHWDCLACEREAWAAALKLWPFSDAMYTRMKTAMRQRRKRTAAPSSAQHAADRLAGLGWAIDKQRRLQRAMRVERQRMVDAVLTEEALGGGCAPPHPRARVVRAPLASLDTTGAR